MSLALDAAELLFNVVANVDGGTWKGQTCAWQDAALLARNAYHAALDAERARPDVDIPGHRILDVLRSDYQMLFRLAADRLKSLDAAATAVPTAPEWPGSRYVGTVRSDDPGPRQWAEANKAEQDVIRKPGHVDERAPVLTLVQYQRKVEQLQQRCIETEQEAAILREQLAHAETVSTKRARETDQLRADLKAADGVIIESSETVLTLQRRVAAAERDLTAIRQVLNPEQWATADVRQGPERLDRKV